MFNERNSNGDIDGIKITNEIKYLGVRISNSRKIFTKQKTDMISKAQRLANCTYSVIAKSVNKVLIGKTFWKHVALPSVLHGMPIVELTKTDLAKLQRIENGVYRRILGGQRYTPICTLRGDIGASLMESRNIETKLIYYKYMLNCKNELLREIMKDMEEKKHKFYKECKIHMETLGIEDIEQETKNSIKDKVKNRDSELWKNELREKSSLSIYRLMKENIKEETIYENNFASVLWYRARANTLPLENRKRFQDQDTTCKICQKESEDILHFLLECEAYTKERSKIIELQRPYMEDKERIVGEFLFEEKNLFNKKKTLETIWKIRKDKMETDNI